MLHAKFQHYRTSGSGMIFKGYNIYVYGDHFGHVTWNIYTNFCSPFLRRLHIKLALIGLVVSEEMFEHSGRRRQRRRVYYKLTYEPLAQVSLYYMKVCTHVKSSVSSHFAGAITHR